jgi:predicted RecB family nuclease
MAMKITRDVIESYLHCRYKSHLKLAGEQGSPSDYERLMRESRERIRLAGIHKLLVRHKEGEVLRGCIVTPTVLKRGVPLLLDATVEAEEFSLRFDALQRVAGSSRLGNFHYMPVLFHEAEMPAQKLRALLELLGLVLGAVQGRQPGWGVLMHGRYCEVARLRLRPNAEQIRRAMEELKAIQGAGRPPSLTLNSHCQICEFRHRCHAEATAKDDLSLLQGIVEKEIRKYGRRGIFTVTQLSCTFRPRKKGKQSKQKRQPHQHALQALAIREKKIHVLGTPELPVCTTRIYFDIEGDPERRFDYLLGMIVDANGVMERHSLWADSPAEEPRLFLQFLDVVGRYGDVRIYCYGSYEAVFLRRMIKVLKRQELDERLLSRVVNVLSVIYSHVYFPTYSNGLKDIGKFLGFRWTEADASGIQSIVWRRKWEETRLVTLKDMLTTYNLEDCAALKRVTEFLYATCSCQCEPQKVSEEGLEIVRVEEISHQSPRPDWGEMVFALPDFSFVNERAHFDYQRDKVFIRTSKTLRKDQGRKGTKRWKKNRRVNPEVEISTQSCPCCGGTELARRQNRSLARLAFDLRITRSGIKRWVTRYRTTWHHCAGCGKRFLPSDYLRLEEFCHSLTSWAMYEHVAHRTSLPNIADTIRECFNMPIGHPQVHAFKQLLADYYQGTYKRLLEKIVGGALLHVDETEVHVRRVGKGYVWVFTNLEEVVYLYRPSREGDFLHDLLKDFRGVLVSDFYAAYDSLNCPQQKCLVHLLRDFNQDIVGNPWDEELKSLASAFGSQLRAVVATIDQYGLRQQHLGKHRRDVERFFQTVAAETLRSEVAEGYRKRLLKYRDKLFTFLDYDAVPWNNNNAEHAVKGFAYYREVADNLITEGGLNQYLVLLSIYQTCKYKGVSFLKFLVSGETDIDVFSKGRGERVLPVIELYPDGMESSRPSRKRLGVQAAGSCPPRNPMECEPAWCDRQRSLT